MPRLLANGRMRPARSRSASYANAGNLNQNACLSLRADRCAFNVLRLFKRQRHRLGSADHEPAVAALQSRLCGSGSRRGVRTSPPHGATCGRDVRTPHRLGCSRRRVMRQRPSSSCRQAAT
jgi:hypothetical protein